MKLRKCSQCMRWLERGEFYARPEALDGLRKECRQCYVRRVRNRYHFAGGRERHLKWRHENVPRRLLSVAKSRARRAGVPFNLTHGDIVVPEVCPIMGTKFVYGDRHLGASVDRFVPSLGYVKGNVWVISRRANSLKSDSTVCEVERLAKALRAELSRRFRAQSHAFFARAS